MLSEAILGVHIKLLASVKRIFFLTKATFLNPIFFLMRKYKLIRLILIMGN